MSEFITETINGEAAGDWPGIHTAAAKHHKSRITVESWTEGKAISERQRKWWKGILLPALSKDTGNSIAWWENKLKLEVMPEEFQPKAVNVDGYVFRYLPSIKDLSITKTNQLIEGSVDYLRNNDFDWVTLPDSEKRKT